MWFAPVRQISSGIPPPSRSRTIVPDFGKPPSSWHNAYAEPMFLRGQKKTRQEPGQNRD